ncbi:SpoIIE family protein phosphatase [Streptomyces odonnellii]|uniref:SpoIIE family protein phosphatase n=1 Tax=Streptomyces odonnellii TaxID=1417980 RepID=UPI0007C6ABBF|nr:SpoIIE family protein phosphatase [Streptomyces odonnellii]
MGKTIRTGVATREGTAQDNADAARVYVLADGTVGAAVVDGIGHGPYTSRTAPLLAEVAARIAARRGPLAGLLTAGELVADPGADGEEADAVAVAAQVHPDGNDVVVAWSGDCRAYGGDGTVLSRYSDDHTVGAQLRRNGVPLELAKQHDNWLKTALSKATVGTVYSVTIPHKVVILTSDGAHDQIPHTTLEALVRTHQDEPQALADAIVAAAEPNEEGYRDDATVVVIVHESAGSNETEDIREETETVVERVDVRVLLLVGSEAEIVADAEDADTPERYPAQEIADAVGVPVEELPGVRLTAVVGSGDRLAGWQRR